MSKGYVERPLTEAESDRIRLRGRKEVKYFNKVYLSVTAASKMLNHAHFGQPREVMGLLQGTPSSPRLLPRGKQPRRLLRDRHHLPARGIIGDQSHR